MARMMLPPFPFAGGDYRLRPFGRVIEVASHWAETSLERERLVCPDSINNRLSCKRCAGEPPLRAFVLSCWDYRSKRFAQALLPCGAWDRLARAYGGFSDGAEEGLGPDLIMQRTASGLQFEVGLDGMPPWEDRPLPDWEGAAEAMTGNSIWIKYDRADVEKLFPRKATP